jgi:hypothetical protein
MSANIGHILMMDLAEMRLTELRAVADRERRAQQAQTTKVRRPWYAILTEKLGRSSAGHTPVARPRTTMPAPAGMGQW